MKKCPVFIGIVLVTLLIFNLFLSAQAQNFKERKIVVFKDGVDEQTKEFF